MAADNSIGRKAAGGAMYAGASQALRVVFTMLSTIVVARLLSPSDYGVIAMAAPVMSFILLFQNLGLDQAVIQSRTISPEQLTGLFWVNMIASTAIVVVLLALSPVVAWFYHDVRAGYIVAASSITVLLSGSALQHSALLNRELRFRALSLIDVAMSATTFVATFIAAVLLKSYWALWIGSVCGIATKVALVWWIDRWRPTLRFSLRGMRAMLRFGGGLTGFNILNFFSRNLDNVLIAHRWGSAAVGLYDRGYKLMMFPIQNINSPISQVMLPLLGRLRDEPVRFRRAYLSAVQAIQLAAIPGMAVAIAASNRVVPFLLGDRWAGVAPIFFWLGLNALLQPIGNSTGWLFITSGRTGAMMRWGVLSSVVSVASFFIGLPWGAVGVAIAYFCGVVLRAPLAYWWSTHETPVRARDLWRAQCLGLLTAGASYGITWLLNPHFAIFPLLCVAVPLAYIISFLIQYADKDGRMMFLSLYNLLPRPFKRPAPATGVRTVDPDDLAGPHHASDSL